MMTTSAAIRVLMITSEWPVPDGRPRTTFFIKRQAEFLQAAVDFASHRIAARFFGSNPPLVFCIFQFQEELIFHLVVTASVERKIIFGILRQ